jgi:hypothetical protein
MRKSGQKNLTAGKGWHHAGWNTTGEHKPLKTEPQSITTTKWYKMAALEIEIPILENAKAKPTKNAAATSLPDLPICSQE